MLERLKKFITKNAIAIILATIPPLGIWYYFQRDHVDLNVIVKNDVPVIALNQQFSEGVELRYHGRRVSSLNVVDVEVENSGTVAIRKTDFDTPLMFDFGGDIIASPNVVTRKPTALKPIIVKKSSGQVEIEPLLLNSDDRFTLRTFVADRTAESPLTV